MRVICRDAPGFFGLGNCLQSERIERYPAPAEAGASDAGPFLYKAGVRCRNAGDGALANRQR
ncbi:hypothetical protein XmelCFBP4644_05270 [Xanthomonas melonis]|uniref:Uncharacterized protein n=1 Tax=Xanthomonas melonis TaxID=56456 RepID=A0A2S7DJ66_9XANT|nr:hypothetical protein XmelCFBP4644_05270 [Xanthomonas melonis]